MQLSTKWKPRSIRLAVPLALVLVLAFAGATSAAMRSTITYHDPGGRNFMSIGLWGGWAYYGATWDVSQDQDAGRTWWVIRNLEVWGAADLGKDCEQAGYCTGWLFSGRAEFLNSAGAVLYTINQIAPPNTGCWSHQWDHRTKVLIRCNSTHQAMNVSVTKIKFKWNMSVKRRDGLWFSWPQVTKTVNIR
jgi:hypothetical protein